MLSTSRSFKVVKKLLNQGVVSKTFLQKYKERMAPVVAAIRSKPVHEPDDTEYWEGIRNLFAYNDDTHCVPINAANLCPNFESVQQTVNDLQLELNLDVSIQKRVDVFSLVIDNAREEIAQQLGVGSDEIALMRNTSEANCAINNGVELNEGDEVVIWAQNHSTNKRAWEIRQQRSPFTIVTVPSDLDGGTSQDDVVQSFVNRLTDATKVVTFSHLSNESGVLLPAKEICQAVHQFNPAIHVHVDGAQTWGTMPVNLPDLGCDSYAASAHKWFVGPKEAGILYMKLSRIPNFMPNIFCDGKIILPEELYNDARRFEILGQRSDPTLMGLLNTAELLGGIGYDAIDARVAYLGTLVYDGFQAIGLQPITTPSDPSRRRGVIVAGVDPELGQNIYNYLYDEHKIGIASTGGLRVSPNIVNTEAQIERLIQAIDEYGN